MTKSEFDAQVTAQIAASMIAGSWHPVTVNGVRMLAVGHYYAGCGIGYSSHGEPIDPPEPPAFELNGLYVGNVNILPALDFGGSLIEHIEQLVIEDMSA